MFFIQSLFYSHYLSSSFRFSFVKNTGVPVLFSGRSYMTAENVPAGFFTPLAKKPTSPLGELDGFLAI